MMSDSGSGTDTMMNGNPKMTGKQVTLKSMAHHTITTKIRKEKRMISDLDARLKDARLNSERALASSCEMIGRISRLSQISPKTTGMSIEEVDEFIKRTTEEIQTKFEKMTLVEMLVDMTIDVLTKGGEDA